MTSHGAKFGRKQEEAIAALLTQRDVEESAKFVGIAPRTLMRWMKLPEFRTAYPEARGQVMGQSNARLQQASSAAVTTLLKLMVSPEVPASTRVRAAQCVVELAHKSFEVDNSELQISSWNRGRRTDQTGIRKEWRVIRYESNFAAPAENAGRSERT